MTFVQNEAAGISFSCEKLETQRTSTPTPKKKENKLQNFIPVCPKTPKQELCQKPFTHFLAAVTSYK